MPTYIFRQDPRHLVGLLLVEEAGGLFILFRLRPYRLGPHSRREEVDYDTHVIIEQKAGKFF